MKRNELAQYFSHKCEHLCAHGDTCAHTCTDTHVASSSRLILLPIVLPQFAISQPNRSHPINVFDFRGSLFISISPPSASLFFTPYNISLCLTTLALLFPANKLHQFPNYLNIQLPCARCLLVLCFQTIFMCCRKPPSLQHVLISR